MTFPVCPCDGAELAPPVNLPGLPHIAYRVGTYVDFRRALLTALSGEQTLSVDGVPVWRTTGDGDLAVMIAEWFAYIADILTFYNERIANQDYLRTADLPESVAHLIAILGYRPRPAIGAKGVLAALVTPGQSATLPAGLQFQSKPAPGQSPQTFELSAPGATIGPPDRIPAIPPPLLLASVPPQSTWTALLGGLLAAQTEPSHQLTPAARAEIEAEFEMSSGSQPRKVERKTVSGGTTDSLIDDGEEEEGFAAGLGMFEGITFASVPSSADYSLLLRGAVDSIDPGATLVW
jgi:hypothetical protein